MTGKPQWYMMDSLFSTRDDKMVMTSHGEKGYIRGKIEDHYIFRVDFTDEQYQPEIIESIYGSILAAAEHMGIPKEKTVIFPSNIDVCRLIPCDESMHEKLEALAKEQHELMDSTPDSDKAN